jgi:ADP-heptose:LPS heptosyltransferase
MAGRFPILYVTEARVEDSILSSGVLKRLHDEIPNAAFTVVGGPETAPLYRDGPGLEALHVVQGDSRGDWLKLWASLRLRRWGLVVDLRGSRLSDWLSRKKRAVRTPLDPEAGPMHKVLQAARVLQLDDDPPAPFLFTGGKTEAAAHALIKRDGPILAIGPGADWVGKTWPAERFTKVATALLGADGPMPDGRLMIVGAEADRDAAHTIRFAVQRDRVIETQGKLDLLQTCAALKRARLYVGNDSLWTHLAAAAGVPTLAAFGPSDETIEGPWGADARTIRGPKLLQEFRAVDPGLNQAINHMYDLRADPVVDAAVTLHAQTESEVAEAV